MKLIDRDALLKELMLDPVGRTLISKYNLDGFIKAQPIIKAEPTLREKALLLLVNWAEECGFGYDNFPDEYEMYRDEIEGMDYIEGMIYIAERVVESTEIKE